MKQITTQGIVLSRTEFGEADRILKFLTPDHGKVSAIAKGVRKSKSKLAGGIELFSVSELSFIVGRSEIYTTTSARLIHYYDNIVKKIDHTNTGYECIKLLDKATAEQPESAYFYLLTSAFEALDDLEIDPRLVQLWFSMQLIKLAGHTPNLHTDAEGNKLSALESYNFDFDHMQFIQKERGSFNANHIKFMRLGFSDNKPQVLNKIENSKNLTKFTQPLINNLLQNFVRT